MCCAGVIEVDDDLFADLDCDSLSAMLIVSRIRDLFSVEVSLEAMFAAPTAAKLAGEIDRRRWADQPLLPPLEPVSRERALPLSFGQQRLWYLHQLEPNATYNMSRALRMVGTLDVAALRPALGEILRRHESLRTNFRQIDGQPVQVIRDWQEGLLPVVDLTCFSQPDQEQNVARHIHAEARQPFSLDLHLLFRARLLRLSDELHVLLLTVHHIVFDEWSLGILLSELSQLYRGLVTGQCSPLPQLPIRYADYAQSQRKWLAAGGVRTQLAYWQRQLAGSPDVVTMPRDGASAGPRQASTAELSSEDQNYAEAREVLTISPELAEGLKALSRDARVTLFMTLEAAFAVFIHLYTGGHDIPVGTPIANRNRKELEPLIGFFVNTLVLRNNLTSNPSFLEFMVRVRQTCLEAYAHQDVPFDKLVEHLRPKRDPNYNPLFQVMFDLHESSHGEAEWPGLSVELLAAPESGAMFDLSVTIHAGRRDMRADFDYNPRLFRSATVRQWTSHFHRVLQTIVAKPETRLSEFNLLSESERHQQVVVWNNAQENAPRRCLHHIFADKVSQHPDAIAVREGRSPFTTGDVPCQLTYNQLDEWSNRLAHHLRGLGAGPEVLVGICVERSVEMIVGILAILKSGSAYVPLDPQYPRQRLAYMLADANAAIVLTQSGLETRLPDLGQPIVYVDAPESQLSHYPDTVPPTAVTPDNLCYLIYTSGSTGRAKGVQVTHAAAANLAHCMGKHYCVTEHDRYLQFSSLSFDCAVEEVFPALLNGATLVLRRDDWLSSPATFLKCCQDEQLTIINLPTPYFHQLARADELDGFQSSLRVVAYGGQAARMDELVALAREAGWLRASD